MIRPLRHRHRVMVCTLGVLLPLSFAAGLWARKPVPIAANLPPEIAGQASGSSQLLWIKADIWPGQRIVTSLHQDAAGSAAVALMFQDLTKPDVLVYWATGKDSLVEGLPENAQLLGVLSNRTPLLIPSEMRGEIGRFLLYSLADHEILAASKTVIVPKG